MRETDMMRVYLNSIGCRLNQSEMESLARQLMGCGHQIVHSPAEAGLCILNTCAVTREAERKSRQAARKFHRANPETEIILTGCYVTLSPAETAALPGVTRVVSNAEKGNLCAILDPDGRGKAQPVWRLPGGRTRAFVGIQDGCDNHCAFCVITIARGPGRSRPPAEVIAEIQALEAAGYQEVVLTGVHVGSYGRERGDGRRGDHEGSPLQILIQTILSETGIPRLRLSSLEPWDLEADFFDLWSPASPQSPRLCRQLHLPLQSGSAGTLRRMGRRTTPEMYRALALAALAAIPDLALTTDVMVGFPGESEAEFEESLAFVRQLDFAPCIRPLHPRGFHGDFARLHVFGYSPRPGTAAANMENQLSRPVIRERSQRMRELGRQKQETFRRRFLGRTMEVLWESPAGDGLWRGHTDNYIQVTAASERPLGNIITPTLLTELRPGGIRGIVKRETRDG